MTFISGNMFQRPDGTWVQETPDTLRGSEVERVKAALRSLVNESVDDAMLDAWLEDMSRAAIAAMVTAPITDGERRTLERFQTGAYVPHGELREAIRKLLNGAALSSDRLREALSDDECNNCGKTRSQHHTGSGVGMCQLYPIFRSRRAAYSALVDRAMSALHPEERGE